MDDNYDALIRALLRCRDCPGAISDEARRNIVDEAIAVIRLLHGAQFRWIPVRSQEEKDEELWRKHLGTADAAYVDSYAREIAHLGFIQGLKAARGEKL